MPKSLEEYDKNRVSDPIKVEPLCCSAWDEGKSTSITDVSHQSEWCKIRHLVTWAYGKKMCNKFIAFFLQRHGKKSAFSFSQLMTTCTEEGLFCWSCSSEEILKRNGLSLTHCDIFCFYVSCWCEKIGKNVSVLLNFCTHMCTMKMFLESKGKDSQNISILENCGKFFLLLAVCWKNLFKAVVSALFATSFPIASWHEAE